ncbi:MAG TPA: ribosome silencing factor [Clostridia bacterium]|nr:ribosome silencing factor [Clostridia bacterium]
MEPNIMKDKIVEFLSEKKARDISVIDIKNVTIIADYFVICSGNSTTHIKAIADELEFKMAEAGCNFLHKEGYNSARWILLDYGNVVVHIFHEEERSFYNLERLWNDGVITLVDNK